MSQKKYQVFVSSTFRDLVDERRDTIQSILDLNHIPAGMESFPASDVEQIKYISKIIDECDYYVLIIGGRYGSIGVDGISYTEKEYDYAVKSEKFIIAFVHRDPASIPVGKSDTDSTVVDSLNRFRDKVMKGRLVKLWSTRQELESLVLKALNHAFNDFPQVGWIRGDSVAKEDLLEQLNRTLWENASLKDELDELQTQKILPKIEDIADLYDTYDVRINCKFRENNVMTYRYATISVKWKEIFVSIAGFLENIVTDDAISDGIIALSREKGLSYVVHSVNKTDVITIITQFIALGLIEKKTRVNDKGKEIESISLTPLGRQRFVEERVVRKKLD